jgi:hypothetical protein
LFGGRVERGEQAEKWNGQPAALARAPCK